MWFLQEHNNAKMSKQLLTQLITYPTSNVQTNRKSVHWFITCCAISFFMQFKTLRRREKSRKLSLGRIANSISHQAHPAFCSFQYPCVPAAMLGNRYPTGLFTDIFHSALAFQSKIQSVNLRWSIKHKLKSKSKSMLVLFNNGSIPNYYGNRL